jgi:hypothetical protein
MDMDTDLADHLDITDERSQPRVSPDTDTDTDTAAEADPRPTASARVSHADSNSRSSRLARLRTQFQIVVRGGGEGITYFGSERAAIVVQWAAAGVAILAGLAVLYDAALAAGIVGPDSGLAWQLQFLVRDAIEGAFHAVGTAGGTLLNHPGLAVLGVLAILGVYRVI